MVSQFDRLCLKVILTCRKWEAMSTSQTSYQHIVQYFERRNVLHQYHDERAAGHFGIRKTLSKVGLRYYWPVLQRDVRQSQEKI